MKRSISHSIAFIALLFSIVSGQKLAAQQSDKIWTIDQAKIQCILDHKNEYLSQTGPIIAIVVSQCPETDFEAALKSLVQNSSIPNLPTAAPNDIIFFSRRDAICLKQSIVTISEPFALIPRVALCDR